MDWKKKLAVTAAVILITCIMPYTMLAAFAMPEYSPDGHTCIVPGCHSEGEVDEPEVDPATLPTPPVIAEIDGAEYYTGTATGFCGHGDVEVTIAVLDGEIVDVVAYGPHETDTVGSVAIEQMPGEILEQQTWDVDGVSGATHSSDAVREAAMAAMEQAGLSVEPVATATPEPTEQAVSDETPVPNAETPAPAATIAPAETTETETAAYPVVWIIAGILVLALAVIFYFTKRKKH